MSSGGKVKCCNEVRLKVIRMSSLFKVGSVIFKVRFVILKSVLLKTLLWSMTAKKNVGDIFVPHQAKLKLLSYFESFNKTSFKGHICFFKNRFFVKLNCLA